MQHDKSFFKGSFETLANQIAPKYCMLYHVMYRIHDFQLKFNKKNLLLTGNFYMKKKNYETTYKNLRVRNYVHSSLCHYFLAKRINYKLSKEG